MSLPIISELLDVKWAIIFNRFSQEFTQNSLFHVNKQSIVQAFAKGPKHISKETLYQMMVDNNLKDKREH